jgi:hypothetical protein
VLDLEKVVSDFASGMTGADALSPQWVSRSGRAYQPGIGPHAEVRAVELVVREMRDRDPVSYAAAVPRDYPGSRLKCDLVIGDPPEWAIEVKMARAFGDNGKLDDTWLKDLLSPYAEDHSALSDAEKLRTSGFACSMAVLVYGFDYSSRPLDRALDALDVLLRHQGPIGERIAAPLADLVHPVHARGLVTAWEVRRPQR